MVPRRVALLLVCCLTPWAAHANAGGYSYGVDFTGSVAPFQATGTERVQIVREDLTIDLRRAEAYVTVRYLMQNVSAEATTVRFGFPVEATDPNNEELDDSEETRAKTRTDWLKTAVRQLRDYSVSLEGKPVEATFEVEPLAREAARNVPGLEKLAGIAGWMVSEVTFPPGAPVKLEVRYSAAYSGSESSVSDDEEFSDQSFLYRLSTGAVWKGPIRQGTVTLRAVGIEPDAVEIASPRDRFRRQGATWTWSFSDLEPTLADDLWVRAIPGYARQPSYDGEAIAWLRLGKTWGEGHQRFTARASSTLKPNSAHSFGAENLAEPGGEVPWSEGVRGYGIGEWVELRTEKPKALLALEITPGFASDPLFQANGRPTRLEILLNGQHRFQATLADSPWPQLIPVYGYRKPVSTVRVTILEVAEGTKYQDTCITRVVLFDRLAKEPAHHGAR